MLTVAEIIDELNRADCLWLLDTHEKSIEALRAAVLQRFNDGEIDEHILRSLLDPA